MKGKSICKVFHWVSWAHITYLIAEHLPINRSIEGMIISIPLCILAIIKKWDIIVGIILGIALTICIISIILHMFRSVNWQNTHKIPLGLRNAIKKLSTEEALYSIRGFFNENITSFEYLSKELFWFLISDPKGTRYWKGWFSLPTLDIFELATIFAIHGINEQQKNKSLTDYRKDVFSALKGAAIAKETFFQEGAILLSDKKTTPDKIELQPESIGKEIKLNPKGALEWFMETVAYSDLVPKSLGSWWKWNVKRKSKILQLLWKIF